MIEPFLPEGYLRLAAMDGQFQLYAGGRGPITVDVQEKTKQEDLIASLNCMLLPDCEIRHFTPVEGDGYPLFVAPASAWQDIECSNAAAIQKYFLTAERLATCWRKGYPMNVVPGTVLVTDTYSSPLCAQRGAAQSEGYT